MATSVLQPNGLWPPAIELTREQLDKLLATRKQQGRPLSLAKLGDAIDRSASMLSDFLHHKERGDVPGLAERIKNFLDLEHARESSKRLAVPFCDTQQAKAITQAVSTAHRYGEMVAVICKSGDGKSRTIEELQARDRTLIVITAHAIMGPQGLLRRLCREIGEVITGIGDACYERALNRLRDTGRCLLVDDASDLPIRTLQILRSLQSQTRIGLVLCGISTMKRRWLSGHNDELEQLASRVASNVWDVPAFGEDDAMLILKAVMQDDDEAEAALALLREDPRSLQSARRLVSALAKAGKLAERKKTKVTVELLRRVLKDAA